MITFDKPAQFKQLADDVDISQIKPPWFLPTFRFSLHVQIFPPLLSFLFFPHPFPSLNADLVTTSFSPFPLASSLFHTLADLDLDLALPAPAHPGLRHAHAGPAASKLQPHHNILDSTHPYSSQTLPAAAASPTYPGLGAGDVYSHRL